MKPDGTQISVAIVGATGYVGGEIVRLLQEHPYAKVTLATSNRNQGVRLREKCPWIATDIVLSAFEPEKIEADFVFLCQEAGYAMQFAPLLVKKCRVIDMAADFRLKPASVYEHWYGKKHTSVDLLEEAVYGLPELVETERIAKARIIGNPGCYPTASSLALAPLTHAGLVRGIPIIDAKSGTSGAGRSKTDTDYLFSELDGNFKAYGVVGHRHTPEIEQNIGCQVRFTPHLLPTARGIYSTIHAPIAEGTTRQNILDAWHKAYEGRKFVSILETGWPTLKQVVGSNRCVMAADVDQRTGHAILVSVIDNMIKGAAGQAIQNMNIMSGLPETTGLPLNGIWP
jgi:N-acetyl-gamma-glutamyl-phosphate reductase